MSAYAGTWNIDGRPTDRNFLAKLNAVIAQYGPDGDKIYFDGSVGMLYCAFQTTPESQREHQPHVSSRGLVLSWDGRLDNRDELIDALREGLLADETDPAIIAAAFEHWGTDCFHRLIGDWAVTIWNPSDMTLVLARDFVGVRHLYYYMTPEKVVWCTHLGALVMVSNVPFVLNDEYVLGYLALWPEAHLTPYRGVHAVPPGKFVRIHNDGRAKIHSYWLSIPTNERGIKMMVNMKTTSVTFSAKQCGVGCVLTHRF